MLDPSGSTFLLKMAPTWVPGPAIIAIAFETGVEMTSETNLRKTDTCGTQVEAQTVPELAKGFPGSSGGASKCSQMQTWASKSVDP